jgi:hypothetical protein
LTEKSEEILRHYIWKGVLVFICPDMKVPRQCPFVLLVETMHLIGIELYLTLEEL